MFWLNGKPADSVSLSDRSFQYGDGCFTTMLTRGGCIQHWSRHIERMNACLDLLTIPRPDWHQVENWLQQAVKSDVKAGVKLHISRGEGGRGYSPTQVASPNVTISDFIYPPHYEQWVSRGLELGICRTRLGHNPLLAGHKHNNRLEQVLAKAELDKGGFADGIVLDICDNVVETTMANLFWVKDSSLFTPDLRNAGVNGVMRRVVLEQLGDLSLKASIGDFKLEDVLSADEVFVSNSVLGVAPITRIGSTSFDIGKITKRIQEMIDS
ncbi:4-amino-4-deoxychorismate lyase [Vibrio orientalis CIP 102891 = ATCC 33934]|uniref:Aminodeoxychorismate lyase n=1 Tax=Vibrio orientalis CIP 102891 = ATCC 33934 TaxID=675816 RepID=C9QIR0_VIBOR|nr:aminodeoxychorismate lyase [Vibrio orientalis]EEX92787.1 aminodeoxychorismate lyase [Vibrio orientalis CIP 102891 = ATCC 33934]EGU52574.1 4-amino-4-deoxychorismate lyase [Vibrio orientalis CIP 102891 = ATCC 33934]